MTAEKNGEQSASHPITVEETKEYYQARYLVIAAASMSLQLSSEISTKNLVSPPPSSQPTLYPNLHEFSFNLLDALLLIYLSKSYSIIGSGRRREILHTIFLFLFFFILSYLLTFPLNTILPNTRKHVMNIFIAVLIKGERGRREEPSTLLPLERKLMIKKKKNFIL